MFSLVAFIIMRIITIFISNRIIAVSYTHLKALSFDGVEVDAFRHMADLKRLDPMKIFYKKID